jgi:hypothetical protein
VLNCVFSAEYMPSRHEDSDFAQIGQIDAIALAVISGD